MSAFAASGTVETSTDGKTLTYHDQSNYTDNDSSLVLADFVSRIVLVKDSEDNILGTIDLGATDLTGTIAITKDGIYKFVPTLITNEDPARTFTDEVDYFAIQFYNLLQQLYTKLITCGSCCASKASAYANMALECVYSAQNSLITNDFIGAQTAIDSANAFINLSLK